MTRKPSMLASATPAPPGLPGAFFRTLSRRLPRACFRPPVGARSGTVSRGLLALALVPLLLAACGGGRAIREGGRTGMGAETGADAGVSSGGDARTARRGGGYYKDDGPGDEIPDNLDSLPDAVPRQEPLHRFANRPYNVFGKSYTPASRVRPFRQRGIASWYGKKFHGQKTSIGERYDMFAMTAAHPTLPLPSYARVSNPANGKSVVVRVNDRGPFHANRIIDLSYAAAHRLGYINKGSTLVEVEAIVPGNIGGASTASAFRGATGMTGADGGADASGVAHAQAAPRGPVAAGTPGEPGADERDAIARLTEQKAALPDTVASGDEAPLRFPAAGIYLQIGAFASGDNAESLRAHLARELDWLNGVIHVIPGGKLYRVQVGPYAGRGEAEQAAEKIRLAYGQKPRLVTHY